jgi:tRNA G18 (ribose-2'-O)-methylase SpoU
MILMSHATDWQDLFGDLQQAQRRHPELTYAEGAETARWLLQCARQCPETESRLSVAVPLAVVGKPTVLATLAESIPPGVPQLELSTPALSELLGFRYERGVVAVAHRPRLHTFAPQPREKWVLCDAVHDPSNLGALARSARCLGATGLVLGTGCGDIWSRRSVRAAVGHVFQLRIADGNDSVTAVRMAAAAGLCTVAAHRGPLSRSVPSTPALKDGWLLVLGNEDRGVSPSVVDACVERWYIPMLTGTDSLNVATAGALFIDRLGR